MRKAKFQHFTPLMLISILLTLGIIAGKVGHRYFDTIYWFVASLLSWGISFVFYQSEASNPKQGCRNLLSVHGIPQQCFSIYISIFCPGGLLTSHQIDKTQARIQVISEYELSSFDRMHMNVQDFRSEVSQKMQSLNIKDQDFAVISAMTLGDKSSLSQETKDIFSISGASHVLAVSGLHIGIIFQFFILLMGGRRRSTLTIFVSMIAIWAYVLFIGMPASAVRSATMISICSFALLAHKEAISINNLCLAYVIMLLFHPLYLFDISFQMSFSAVFSILFFSPDIKITQWFKGMFCMSLAAQIGTMPLVAYYFGRISCYAIFTGFIAIPAATFILYLSASAMLLVPFTLTPYLTFIATPILHFVANCLVCITQTCHTALKLTTMLPGASIEGIKINIPQLCLIYVSIVVGYILIRKLRQFRFLGTHRHRPSYHKDCNPPASRTSPSDQCQG